MSIVLLYEEQKNCDDINFILLCAVRGDLATLLIVCVFFSSPSRLSFLCIPIEKLTLFFAGACFFYSKLFSALSSRDFCLITVCWSPVSLRPHIFALAITEKQQTRPYPETHSIQNRRSRTMCIYFWHNPIYRSLVTFVLYDGKNTKFRRRRVFASLPRFGMCPRVGVIRHRWFISC